MKLKLRLYSFLILIFTYSIAIAASKEEIDAKTQETLQTFYSFSTAGKVLSDKAAGILIFPSIVKAGFFVGGEFGEGALMIDGKITDYYNIVSASFGYQLGAQERSQVILFMDKTTLDKFRYSDGWDASVNGSIAITTLGAGKDFSVENVKEPIITFVFSHKGLMGNLTLEGTKITKITK